LKISDARPDTPEPIPAAELQRRAITGSSWTAIHVVVSLPVAFVANAVVARSLGVSSYGHLAFLAAGLGLALAFANFGLNNALIQNGSKAEASGRRSEADDLLRRGLGFHMIVELPILVVVILTMTRSDPVWEVAALGVAVLLMCFLGPAQLSMTIENRTAAGAQIALVMNFALQGATVATALLTGSAPAVWAVRTLIPALALGFNLLILDRDRRRAVLLPRLPFGLGSAFWRYSLLSWGSGLVGLLVYSRSEIFLLELFHRTGALGLFALAFGLSQMITAPADAMLHALLPAVAGILTAWPERAAQAFERATRVSSLVCGGVAAVIIPTLFSAVPLIYGGAFRTAAWLFVPLAVVSAFQSANNPVTAFVNGRQRGGLILKFTVVALVVDVAVAVALIPPFGTWGAVAANVAGQLVGLVWLMVTEPLAMSEGFRGLLRRNRAFLFGLTAGALALACGAAVQPSSHVFAPIAACCLGGLIYLAAVRVTRTGLTTQDCEALTGAFGSAPRPYILWILRPLTTSDVA
jgi:O-antigen/teichoic acid export membrane protein